MLLRRRGLAALTGTAHRDPRRLLAELERRKTPDYRSPAERLLWLYAHHGPTTTPHQRLLRLHAMRISQGW